MNFCLFCNKQEPNYKLEKNVEYVCSTCIRFLLQADQDDLKRAHAKAIKHGYESKVTAIEMFILEEDTKNGKQNNKRRSEERFNRIGVARASQFKKITTGKSKIGKKAALFTNK